jgi:hypothetical protein
MQVGDYVRVKDDSLEGGLHYKNEKGFLGKIVEVKHDMAIYRKEYLIEFWDTVRKWYISHELTKE